MAYEQKDGDIAIFLVKDVQGNRPQWTGKALVDGKEKDVSLWIKGDSGTMLAGQIKDKWVPDYNEAKPKQEYDKDPRDEFTSDEFEDSIPF